MVKYYKRKRTELTELQRLSPGCWINVSPPFDHEELENLANRFEIPLDFLTDSLDIDERPRFDYDDDEQNIRLIVLSTPFLNNTSDDESAPYYITVPLGIVLTPDYILTVSSYTNPVLEPFLEGKIRQFDSSDKSLFVLQIFEQQVLRFLSCLKDLNVRRNSLEQELYDSSRNRELLKLLSVEKSLVYFLTALKSNALLLTKIQRTDFLRVREDEIKSDLLEDVLIDINQASEMANIYSNILSGTMDAFGSIISNNLNRDIQRLTLITIFLMAPTLVASFFGMNVPLPLQNSPYAFTILMFLALSISVGLVVMFRKQKML
jgi:magnesium transporter